MSTTKPHVATVKLTEQQFRLARTRIEHEHLSWQRVLSAAVDAYIVGELKVTPVGNWSVSDEGDEVLSFVDGDADALDLDDLVGLVPAEGQGDRPYGQQVPETIGTRELAERAEAKTGRRVSIHMLRSLLRERFPEARPEGSTQYRWDEDDPQIGEIIQAIADGALDEIRHRRLSNL